LNYYKTVAQMQAVVPVATSLAFCEETGRNYFYAPDSADFSFTTAPLPVSPGDVIATGAGGNSRWISTDFKQVAQLDITANITGHPTSSLTKVALNNNQFDNQNAVNTSTNRITVANDGFYHFAACLRMAGQSNSNQYDMRLRIYNSGGTALKTFSCFVTRPSSGVLMLQRSGIWPVSRGDYIEMLLDTPNTVTISSLDTELTLHQLTGKIQDKTV